MQEAVIIDCLRTAVGKAPRGTLRNSRPDDLAAACHPRSAGKVSAGSQGRVEDVILGCAMPEAESGNNMARQAALRAGLPDIVHRRDHQPLLQFRPAGHRHGGRPHPLAAARTSSSPAAPNP